MALLNLTALLSIGQGLFLIVYLLSGPYRKFFPTLLLSAIVLIESLILYDSIMVQADYNLPLELYYIGTPLTLLLGPFLYYYAKSITDGSFTFGKKDYGHLLPFFMLTLIVFWDFHQYTWIEKEQFIIHFRSRLDQNGYETSWPIFLINSSVRLMLVVYLLAGFRLILQKKVGTTISYGKMTISSKFVKFLYFSGIMLMLHSFVTGVLRFVHLSYVDFVSHLTTLIFSSHIFGLAFIYLKGPVKELGHKGKYAKSGLNEIEEKRYFENLLQLMDNQQPFKDPLLTLPKLAAQLGLNPHYLSQIINRQLNQSYHEMINQYRIAYSKGLLKDKTCQHLSIEEIGLASGYAVKSTFYRSFKSQEGLTPLQYRKSMIK